MNESVSIIITVYNGERFLEDTIKAVLAQSYNNIELILVNDGSKDNSLEICNEYKKKDNRVKVVNKENGGMSSGRAAGYEVADKASWVLFFDADDIPAPNMIEALMKYKDADVVLSCFENMTSQEILNGSFEMDYARVVENDGKYFLNYLQNSDDTVGVLGNLCGVLLNPVYFAREYQNLKKKKNDYPQNYLNDAYSIPRLVYNADNIVFFNNNVYHHRLSKYTDSRRLKPNALAYELLEVQKDNLKFYKKNASSKAYESMFLGYMLIILKLWYQVVMYEDDEKKASDYKRKIESEFAIKWKEFKKIKYGSISKKMYKHTIGVFALNHTLWKMTIGYLRYGLQYKLKS